MWNPGECRKTRNLGEYWNRVRVSTGKVGSERVPKKEESRRVLEKYKSRRVQEKGRIWASTENVGFGRVPERWSKYRKDEIQANTGKVGIRGSTENVESGRIPENHQTKRG